MTRGDCYPDAVRRHYHWLSVCPRLSLWHNTTCKPASMPIASTPIHPCPHGDETTTSRVASTLGLEAVPCHDAIPAFRVLVLGIRVGMQPVSRIVFLHAYRRSHLQTWKDQTGPYYSLRSMVYGRCGVYVCHSHIAVLYMDIDVMSDKADRANPSLDPNPESAVEKIYTLFSSCPDHVLLPGFRCFSRP